MKRSQLKGLTTEIVTPVLQISSSRASISFARAAFLLSIILNSLFCVPSFAKVTADVAKLVRAFDLGKGDVALCYDQKPAFVFAPTDIDGTHAIKIVSFDGEEREIFRVSGKIISSTLSCSDDGKVIAFVRSNASSGDYALTIIGEGTVSEYRMANWTLGYPIEGGRSLLSEDGHGVALPSPPEHVSGPDIISDMRLFVYSEGKTFFSGDLLIHDHGKQIEGLSFTKGKWDRKFVIGKDPSLFLEHAGGCLGRTIALAAFNESNESSKIYDLSSGKFQKPVWLKKPGFSGSVGSDLVAGAGYDRCVYAVQGRGRLTNYVKGFAVVDRTGVVSFAVPNGLASQKTNYSLANFHIAIAKDGCHVLASIFEHQPKSDEDLLGIPTRVIVLRRPASSLLCQ